VAALDQIEDTGSGSASSASNRKNGTNTASDMAAAQQLFAEMTAAYANQIRNLMIEVQWGEAPTSWLQLCEGTLSSLREMAEKVELTALCRALDAFAKELHAAQRSNAAVVKGKHRERLLATYDGLVKIMPGAFECDGERNRREPIIIQSLLLQSPNVRHLTIAKIYQAGITTLDALLKAKASELAQTTGIHRTIAKEIVQLLHGYRERGRSTVAAAVPQDEYKELSELIGTLRTQQGAFEDAASSWSDQARAEKRRLRRERDATILKVNISLARLGEVDRLQAIEKLPFTEKIEQLEGFLQQAVNASPAGPSARGQA
jgi:hypothetical protein